MDDCKQTLTWYILDYSFQELQKRRQQCKEAVQNLKRQGDRYDRSLETRGQPDPHGVSFYAILMTLCLTFRELEGRNLQNIV